MCLLDLLVGSSGQIFFLPIGGENVVPLLLIYVGSFLMLLLYNEVWIIFKYDPGNPNQRLLHSIAVLPNPLILYIVLLTP